MYHVQRVGREVSRRRKGTAVAHPDTSSGIIEYVLRNRLAVVCTQTNAEHRAPWLTNNRTKRISLSLYHSLFK